MTTTHVTTDELTEKVAEAFQRGVALGIKIGKRELDDHPTHLFAVDEPTAEVFRLPIPPAA